MFFFPDFYEIFRVFWGVFDGFYINFDPESRIFRFKMCPKDQKAKILHFHLFSQVLKVFELKMLIFSVKTELNNDLGGFCSDF